MNNLVNDAHQINNKNYHSIKICNINCRVLKLVERVFLEDILKVCT